MEYKRLTKRIGKDNIPCLIGDFYDELEEADFAISALAELEDKIEDGRIIELPCKIGDTVYRLLGKCDGHLCPYDGEFGQWRCFYKGERRCDAFVDEIPFELSNLSDIGKHIFLTKKEAEARMKKFRGK